MMGSSASETALLTREHQKYYRNTFITHEYVRKNWAKYFDILEIIPGYIGNHQDLVVTQKAIGSPRW